MSIRRVCSYSATIQTPVAPSNYSAIVVTFAQNGTNLISKNKSALTLGDSTVTVNLTQAETKLFEAGKIALMQIRCYHSAYDAPGSAVWCINVEPSLTEDILS